MLLIQTLRYAQCFAYRWVKFAEYEVYGEDEKNYKKDGSWVWVEDEEHIKVQYRDSSGGIQRWYVKKEGIKKDEEWSGDCIITTACVKSMKLPDHCSELQAFRKLRDDYLIKKPKGKVFIEFYYCLSPCILEIIIMKDTQIKFQIYHDWVIPIT